MIKNTFLQVNDTKIPIFYKDDSEYFSLTDMINDSHDIRNWMRMPKTIEI